jgi:hypothetical protein
VGFFSRKRQGRRGSPVPSVVTVDRGVPDLERPIHALLHVLNIEWVPDIRGRLSVDVEPVGSAPYRIALPYDRHVDIVSGVVVGFTVPGLTDAAHPERVILLEPPGGPDLPLVEEDLARARLERDARTEELSRRYPAPSVSGLRQLLSPGSVVPAFQAARFRARLTTSHEARALVHSAMEAGITWKEASDRLQGLRTMASEVHRDAAECFSHVDDVAPAEDLDEQVLMNMLLTIRQVDQTTLQPQDQALAQVVLEPWERILGPVW